MRWQWMLGNFADPQYDLATKEQREVTDLAHRKYMRARTLAAWTACIVAPLLLMWNLIPPVLIQLGITGQNAAHWIAFVLVCLTSWPLAAWVYGHAYERAVRRAMREKGYDVCENCGYQLGDRRGDVKRCPECGRQAP